MSSLFDRQNITVTTNTERDVWSYGGAILALQSHLTISNSTLSNNSAGRGGAIASLGLDYPNPVSSFTIVINTVITNCKSLSDGGGLYLQYSTSTLTESTINECDAVTNDGGGIKTIASLLVINTCIFSGNKAQTNGGGASFSGGIRDVPMITTIVNTTWTNNSAATGGGGVFYWQRGLVYFLPSIIIFVPLVVVLY
jgi:hypothetical protein